MNDLDINLKRNADAAARIALEETVRVSLMITLRGLLASFSRTPPELLLGSIALQLGNMLASSYHTDLGGMLRLRAHIQEQFKQGVNKAQVITVPATPSSPRPDA